MTMRRVEGKLLRLELIVARAMLDEEGCVRQLPPDDVVALLLRELAKERGRVRKVIKSIQCPSDTHAPSYLRALRDILTALKGTVRG